MWTAFKHGLHCLLGHHRYVPMYEVREEKVTRVPDLRTVRVRHFRYSCRHCETWTPWMDVEEKRQFDLKHQPNWGP